MYGAIPEFVDRSEWTNDWGSQISQDGWGLLALSSSGASIGSNDCDCQHNKTVHQRWVSHLFNKEGLKLGREENYGSLLGLNLPQKVSVGKRVFLPYQTLGAALIKWLTSLSGGHIKAAATSRLIRIKKAQQFFVRPRRDSRRRIHLSWHSLDCSFCLNILKCETTSHV